MGRAPIRDVAGAPDRAKGALVGLALGDALGTTLEFAGRDTKPPVTDLMGGGPFGLAAGEWTDDTSMALCLADSLLERGLLDVQDLMERFLRWWEEGHNSVTGECFDIGVTTAAALQSYRNTGEPLSGSTDPRSAGNGSLMRLSPVAIRWWHDRSRATAAARLQSRTTHGAAQAVEACALYAELLVEAIAGTPKETVLRAREWRGDAQIAEVAAGSWRARERNDISSSGYVLHTLEAALWCVDRSDSIEDALVLAANLADDADTVAAVTGQLAGALWGMSGAPAGWLEKLAWRERLEALAARPVRGRQQRADRPVLTPTAVNLERPSGGGRTAPVAQYHQRRIEIAINPSRMTFRRSMRILIIMGSVAPVSASGRGLSSICGSRHR